MLGFCYKLVASSVNKSLDKLFSVVVKQKMCNGVSLKCTDFSYACLNFEMYRCTWCFIEVNVDTLVVLATEHLLLSLLETASVQTHFRRLVKLTQFRKNWSNKRSMQCNDLRQTSKLSKFWWFIEFNFVNQNPCCQCFITNNYFYKMTKKTIFFISSDSRPRNIFHTLVYSIVTKVLLKLS